MYPPVVPIGLHVGRSYLKTGNRIFAMLFNGLDNEHRSTSLDTHFITMWKTRPSIPCIIYYEKTFHLKMLKLTTAAFSKIPPSDNSSIESLFQSCNCK